MTEQYNDHYHNSLAKIESLFYYIHYQGIRGTFFQRWVLILCLVRRVIAGHILCLSFLTMENYLLFYCDSFSFFFFFKYIWIQIFFLKIQTNFTGWYLVRSIDWLKVNIYLSHICNHWGKYNTKYQNIIPNARSNVMYLNCLNFDLLNFDLQLRKLQWSREMPQTFVLQRDRPDLRNEKQWWDAGCVRIICWVAPLHASHLKMISTASDGMTGEVSTYKPACKAKWAW